MLMIKLDASNLIHPKSLNFGTSNLRYAQLDFTGKCNANCRSCCGLPNHGYADWPFEKACEVMSVIFKDVHLRELYLSCQAEFSLYDYNIDVIDFADNSFKDVILHQDTNGIYIPEGFIEELNSIKNVVYDLSVSLWAGNKDDYIKFHGVDKWEQVTANIRRYLTEVKNPNVCIRFSTPFWDAEQYTAAESFIKNTVKETTGKEVDVITGVDASTPYDYSTYSEKVALMKRASYGWEDVDAANVDKSDGPTYEIEENGEKKLKQLIIRRDSGLVKPIIYKNNCNILDRILIIRANGDIVPCLNALDKGKEYMLGNIFEQKVTYEWLKQCYNSEERKRQIKDNCTKGAFYFCEQCTSRVCY